jgi:biotin transport system substrate-specific component
MTVNQYIDSYRRVRSSAFERLQGMGHLNRILMAFGFALLTAMAAQVRIYTPFSPVPFTLQVFPVLLAGAVLGMYYGCASQLIYTIIGVMGLPVFANWKGGYAVLFGATGGYIVGFVAAAFIVGWVVSHGTKARTSPRILAAMAAGMSVIYLFGATGLALALGVGIVPAFVMGVLPFIGLDIVKIFCAAGITRVVLPGAELQ